MTLIIIGIITVAVGLIGAAINMVVIGSSMFSGTRDPFDSFGATVKRQGLFGALVVIGVALIAIGIVLAVF